MVPAIPQEIMDRKSVVDPAILQTGDLLLLRMMTPGRIQNGIIRGQSKVWPINDSQWTHAAIIKPYYEIMEMTMSGIKLRPLWFYDPNRWVLRIRRLKARGPSQRATILHWAFENSLLYKTYDFLGIWRLKRIKLPNDLFKPTKPLIKGCICSAFFARSVAPLGIDLGQGIDYRLVTPAQLSHSNLLDDVPLSWVHPNELKKWWDGNVP